MSVPDLSAPPGLVGDLPAAVLRSLYDNVSLLMGVVELHGDDILHVSDNPATAAFFGTTPDVLRGQRASALGTDAETVALWMGHYREAERTGAPVRFRYGHAGADGTRWLQVVVSAIGADPASEQTRCIYAAEDVTDQVAWTEALRANEARQEALLRAIPDLLFRIDRDGRYLDVHAPDPDALVAPAEDLLGRTLGEVMPADLAERFTRQIQTAIDTGVMSEVAFDMTTVNDEQRHFEARMSPAGGHDEALVIVRDLTEWTRDRRALGATAGRLRTLIERLQAAVLVEDEAGRVLVANQHFCDLFEIVTPPADLVGDDCTAAIETMRHLFADPDGVTRRVAETLHARAAIQAEVVEMADGRVLERDYVPIDLEGEQSGHLWLYHDVTARVAAERERAEREQRYRLLAEHTRDLIALQTPAGVYEWTSPSAETLLGYTPDDLVGRRVASFVHPDDLATLDRADDDEAVYRIRRKDGRYVWFETLTRPILDDEGRVVQLQTASRDVTERQQMADELFRQAFHDPLTGLPNRALLNTRLEAALGVSSRSEAVAVLFVDLDRFKVVNDTLGHACGDRLLEAVAARLQMAVRFGDTVARLGGDEFALLIDGLPSEGYAEHAARRALDVLQAPVDIDGRTLHVGASIGVATGRPGHDEPGALLREADLAMYAAKAAGRNTYATYDELTHGEVSLRLQLEMDLRHAVARDELRVVYQPIVSLADGTLAGFEALVRWQHPELGLLAPDAFLKPAEESGQMALVDRWVLGEACQQAAAWGTARSPSRVPLRIHVNCSGQDLASHAFTQGVLAALDESGLEGSRLSLEITERTVVEDLDDVSAALRHLQKTGVQFSLDDFGTGYSSLSLLHALPVDTIKVDRSFVGEMEASEASRRLVESVVGLGQMLGKSVVAEGIEGKAQLGALRTLDCPFGQGYLFDRPLSADAACALAVDDATSWKGLWGAA